MKRILLALALIASMQVVGAQVKSSSAVKKAIEAAEAAAANPKKATKPDTWLKLAKAYIDAYESPIGNGYINLSRKDAQLLMQGVKPNSSEVVEIGGQSFTKDSYSRSDYYYNANDVLSAIIVTKPVVTDALQKALDAYKKAYAADTKKAKVKEIAEGIKNVYSKYTDMAYSQYTVGDMAAASGSFESAALTSLVEPYAQLDTNALYNAGLIAGMIGDNANCKRLMLSCLDNNYFGTDGDVFVRLSTIAEQEGDKVTQKDYLEKGFAVYPQSQAILIGLINYYITNHEDTDRLFVLINEAKANDPTNASLSYVEGNIYKELGKIDEAIAAYRKCADINPNYEYGYIGEGILHYNNAIDIQEKASEELDDAKYMALVADFEKELKACIEPFEKAYELSKDDSIKTSISEYLKNACYRFRDEDPNYQAKYDKYNAVLAK